MANFKPRRTLKETFNWICSKAFQRKYTTFETIRGTCKLVWIKRFFPWLFSVACIWHHYLICCFIPCIFVLFDAFHVCLVSTFKKSFFNSLLQCASYVQQCCTHNFIIDFRIVATLLMKLLFLKKPPPGGH